jgi:concentrative nucleoside transporter, CNT family
MQHLQSALGVIAILAIASLFSENRRAVPWRRVAIGLVVTLALALLMLRLKSIASRTPTTPRLGAIVGVLS